MSPKEKRELENRMVMAEDIDNLLDHIAWTDIVYPRLQKLRESLVLALVETNLGRPMVVPIKNSTSLSSVKPEELAGKIYGIDFIVGLFQSVLSGGEVADKALKAAGEKVVYS